MGELTHIGNIRGIKRALEICERMMQKAPPAPKQRDELHLSSLCLNGDLCSGSGFVEVQPNFVKPCDCRSAAIEEARRREEERIKPHRDVVDFLLTDDEHED